MRSSWAALSLGLDIASFMYHGVQRSGGWGRHCGTSFVSARRMLLSAGQCFPWAIRHKIERTVTVRKEALLSA